LLATLKLSYSPVFNKSYFIKKYGGMKLTKWDGGSGKSPKKVGVRRKKLVGVQSKNVLRMGWVNLGKKVWGLEKMLGDKIGRNGWGHVERWGYGKKGWWGKRGKNGARGENQGKTGRG